MAAVIFCPIGKSVADRDEPCTNRWWLQRAPCDERGRPVITVHHLNNSRSQRILWLLEELGLAYEIKNYQRDPKTMLQEWAQGRGLPEAVLLAKAYVAAAIANAHPLGRGTGPVHHLYRMHQQRRATTVPDPEPVN